MDSTKCAVRGCKQTAAFQVISHGKSYQVCEQCFRRIKRLRWDQEHYGEELLVEMRRGYQ